MGAAARHVPKRAMNDSDSDNRRFARRQRTLRTGKILLGAGPSVIDCVVRDISKSGARLAVDEIAIVPERFTLMVVLDGGNRREACRVVWRRPSEIGVLFD